MSSVETTTPIAVAQSISKRLDEHDLDFTHEFLTVDVVETWPVVGRLEGTAAMRNHFAMIFGALPDFHIGIERMAADGDTVLVHWHATGAFTGTPFLGFESTGRSIDIRGTDCFTIPSGKAVTNFVAFDGMDFAVQAGVLPLHGSPMDHAMTFTLNLVTRGRKLVGR